MKLAFAVLWAACKDYYEEMFTLVGANLLWVLIVGLVAGATYLLSLLLGAAGLIPGIVLVLLVLPPATAGMFHLTNQIAHHKSIEFGLVFEGAKLYAVKSWLLTLLNLGVAILLGVNVVFYGSQQFEGQQWAIVVRGLFVGLAVLWVLIQLYVLPMLMEQQQPSLRLAVRNAAFMAFASPITTLLVGVLLILVCVLSIGLTLPFAVAMMAMVGLMCNEAVLRLLIKFGIRKPPEEVA